MKVTIELGSNGYVVTYDDKKQPYVYRLLDDLMMLQEISKQFLKRNLDIKEK